MPQRRHYTPELLTEAIRASASWADVARYFGLQQNGGARGHLQKLAVRWGLDTSHFTSQGWNVGAAHQGGPRRRTAADILVPGSGPKPERTPLLRRALVEIGVPYECAECRLGPVWNGRPLVLQVDHRNGNRFDNRPENLRFLCPNCHTQTPNFGSLNSGVLGRRPRHCVGCGAVVSKKAARCRQCERRQRAEAPRQYKIVWPPTVQLQAMVDVSSYSAVGRKLGVSATSVKNYLHGGRSRMERREDVALAATGSIPVVHPNALLAFQGSARLPRLSLVQQQAVAARLRAGEKAAALAAEFGIRRESVYRVERRLR